VRYHGGYYGEKENVLDFSANLNPLGIPEALKMSARECFEGSTLFKYPDYKYRKLRFAISNFYGFRPEYVLPTNGASEAINLSILASKPKRVIYISPTYGDDCRLATPLNMKCGHILMDVRDQEFHIDPDDVIRRASRFRRSALIWSNPNNPTGASVRPEELIEVANSLPEKSTLIVDEAYIELSGLRSLTEAEDLPDNVIVIRSFTKVFSVPGMRAGFAFTKSRELMNLMEGLAPDWNVNALASCALEKALTYRGKDLHEFISLSSREIRKLRMQFTEALKRAGLEVFNSRANYLLIRHEGIDSIYLQRLLLQKYNVFVRPAHTFYGLSRNYTRISVRSARDNALLVRDIEGVIKRD
jgi:threonine-phosphate decarboxylase